jgi:transposase
VELPEPAEPPDPAAGSDPISEPFAMTISSLSRTERTADLRRIFKARRDLNQSELDSHADTCVAGANTMVTEYTDTKVSVSPFSDSYEAIKDFPIATVATAWDDPATGDVTILYINEALYFGDKMSHTLLCPNQLRSHGWKVQDVPKQFDAESAHAIIDPTGTFRMPLEMNGIISYLPTRKPTEKELDTCLSYVLTSDVPWEPYSPSFREWEQRTAAEAASTAAPEGSTDPASTEEAQSSYVASSHTDMDPFDDGYLLERLIDSVRLTDSNTQRMIASVRSVLNGESESPTEGAEGADPREESAATRSATQPLISTESLAKKWQIGLDKAQATLRATTQTGLWKVINPLGRRYTTRLPHLRYPVVKKTLYSDTMFAKKTKSLRQHTCAQVFTNSVGFTHAYPMKKKSEAGDRLEKLLRTLQTIPEAIVTDGAGEEIGGDWKQTIDKYRIHGKRTKPYSPWQNRAEREIRELKKAVRRTLHASKAPPRMWCFALEWVTEIWRHTVHDIAALNERTPFEHYTGHTPNIAALCIYSFYDYCWYWVRDSQISRGCSVGGSVSLMISAGH